MLHVQHISSHPPPWIPSSRKPSTATVNKQIYPILYPTDWTLKKYYIYLYKIHVHVCIRKWVRMLFPTSFRTQLYIYLHTLIFSKLPEFAWPQPIFLKFSFKMWANPLFLALGVTKTRMTANPCLKVQDRMTANPYSKAGLLETSAGDKPPSRGFNPDTLAGKSPSHLIIMKEKPTLVLTDPNKKPDSTNDRPSGGSAFDMRRQMTNVLRHLSSKRFLAVGNMEEGFYLCHVLGGGGGNVQGIQSFPSRAA